MSLLASLSFGQEIIINTLQTPLRLFMSHCVVPLVVIAVVEDINEDQNQDLKPVAILIYL